MHTQTTQQEFDKRLKRVVVALCTSLRFQQCALYMHENEAEFCIRTMAGLTEDQEEHLRQHPLRTEDVKLLMTVAERINDIYTIPYTSALWQTPSASQCFLLIEEARDILLVPLKSEQHMFVGLLVLGHSYAEHGLTDEALMFLNVFAEQAAMVIEEERLYKEAQQSNEERMALVEIGRAIFAPSALHDVNDVYRTIYEQTRTIMPVDALLIARYNHQHGTMVMEYLIDEAIEYPPLSFDVIPLWIEKIIARETQAYVFDTAEEYYDFASINHPTVYVQEDGDLFGNERPSQSLLFVPIFYGDELIGILSAQSYQRHAYTARHLALLEEIGIHAGIALNNAVLYEKLRQALKEAQKSEQLTNHFLMTASHELRTPLTSIQGYLELLMLYEARLTDEMRKRFVGLASLACEELILLLGNVMDTSRVDQDRVTLHTEVVHVMQAVRRITEILEPTFILESRVALVEIDENLYVQADDLRLRQILLNVVGNALKYAPGSDICITATPVERITLEHRLARARLPSLLSEVPNFIEITVRDRGAGIQQEDIERLFAKFVRLDSAMNSSQRGAGLGLYLCRQLAESMGGQIWAESIGTAGEGATFLLALPQA